MKISSRFVVFAACAALCSFVPVSSVFVLFFVVEEEEVTETNGSKMKQGAKDFFKGLKGSVQEAGATVSNKAKDVTAKAYIGEWYFANGKYSTMIDIADDSAFTITQTKKGGENKWEGIYTIPEKGQFVFHVSKVNGKVVSEDWVVNYEADKKDYIIISSDSIPNDPNGYDFSRRTLFSYVDNDF